MSVSREGRVSWPSEAMSQEIVTQSVRQRTESGPVERKSQGQSEEECQALVGTIIRAQLGPDSGAVKT